MKVDLADATLNLLIDARANRLELIDDLKRRKQFGIFA